jgi:PAS domain-containing protein
MSVPERQSAAMPENWYYEVLEALPVIVYCVDATPPYAPRYISRGVEALGYTREEWLAEPDRWLKSIHPEDREQVVRAGQRAYDAKSFVELEYRMSAGCTTGASSSRTRTAPSCGAASFST